MEIKQVNEEVMRKLVKDIEEGNINLVLVNGNKTETFITEQEKRRRLSEIVDSFDRAFPILVRTFFGKAGVIASTKEKLDFIHQDIEKLNQKKTIMFDTDYEADEIEDIKTDFCDVIRSMTNGSYNFEGNIYDEEIDEIIEDNSKCKVKK